MFGSDAGASIGIILLVIVIGFFLPFIINAPLAKSRGKSVFLFLLLTVMFSWIVTLILAILPKAEAAEKPAPKPERPPLPKNPDMII